MAPVQAGIEDHGTSSSGVGKMTGMSKGSVATAWKVRSNELLTAFRARDLSGIDVLAVYLDGIFLGGERCVVMAMVIDTKGCKHPLDFGEGSSESAEVVNGLLGRIGARGLVVGRDRRVLVLRDGSAAIAKAVREFWPDAVQQECLARREELPGKNCLAVRHRNCHLSSRYPALRASSRLTENSTHPGS